MKRLLHGAMIVAGITASCAATLQVNQIADGRAAPEILNYAITAVTGSVAVGCIGFVMFRSQSPLVPMTDRVPSASLPTDHSSLIAAIDQLFAHFLDDGPAQEAVRVVARAVTERRYRIISVEGNADAKDVRSQI